jgi:hypothetical protein
LSVIGGIDGAGDVRRAGAAATWGVLTPRQVADLAIIEVVRAMPLIFTHPLSKAVALRRTEEIEQAVAVFGA